MYFDRLIFIAEGQHSFDLFALQVGHSDGAKRGLVGEAERSGKEDEEKNRDNSFHDPESISIR
jgi:hypothetical protein